MAILKTNFFNNDLGDKVVKLYEKINKINAELKKLFPESYGTLPDLIGGTNPPTVIQYKKFEELQLKSDFEFNEEEIEQFIDEHESEIDSLLVELAKEVTVSDTKTMTKHGTKIGYLKELFAEGNVVEFNRRLSAIITNINDILRNAGLIVNTVAENVKRDVLADVDKVDVILAKSLGMEEENTEDSDEEETTSVTNPLDKVITIDEYLERFKISMIENTFKHGIYFNSTRRYSEFDNIGINLSNNVFAIYIDTHNDYTFTASDDTSHDFGSNVTSNYLNKFRDDKLTELGILEDNTKMRSLYGDTYVTNGITSLTLNDAITWDNLKTHNNLKEEIMREVEAKKSQLRFPEIVKKLKELSTKKQHFETLKSKYSTLMSKVEGDSTSVKILHGAIHSPSRISPYNASIPEIEVDNSRPLTNLKQYEDKLNEITNDINDAINGFITTADTELADIKTKITEYNKVNSIKNADESELGTWKNYLKDIKDEIDRVKALKEADVPIEIYLEKYKEYLREYNDTKTKLDSEPVIEGRATLKKKETYYHDLITKTTTLKSNIDQTKRDMEDFVNNLRSTEDNRRMTTATIAHPDTEGHADETITSEQLFEYLKQEFERMSNNLSDGREDTLDQWDDKFKVKRDEITAEIKKLESNGTPELIEATETLRNETGELEEISGEIGRVI